MSSEHRVRQGECISSIAFKYGFFADTLWEHRDNTGLKQEREDPDVLLPGDIVKVPELRQKEEPAATGARHSFRRKGVPKKLKVCFTDWKGEPYRNMYYRIEVDGHLSEGTTDTDGSLDHGISPAALFAKIFFDNGHEYEIELGHLDPVSETIGVQQRLRNLGYYNGAVDGELNDATREALRAFQTAQGLEVTGEPDDPTCQTLVDENGS